MLQNDIQVAFGIDASLSVCLLVFEYELRWRQRGRDKAFRENERDRDTEAEGYGARDGSLSRIQGEETKWRVGWIRTVRSSAKEALFIRENGTHTYLGEVVIFVDGVLSFRSHLSHKYKIKMLLLLKEAWGNKYGDKRPARVGKQGEDVRMGRLSANVKEGRMGMTDEDEK